MRALVHSINQFLSGLAGWLMVVLMSLLVTDVIFRSFGRPLLLMAELSVFVMMIVIYLGFSRCEEQREHVRLEFVVNALPARHKPKVLFLANLLAVLVIGLLFYAVTRSAWSTFQTGSAIAGAVDIPIWPTQFIMVIGMGVFLLQSIVNLFTPTAEQTEADRVPDFE